MNEKQYKALIENIPAFVCRFLTDGEITYTNNIFANYFNKEPKELIGQNAFQLFSKENQEIIKAHYKFLSFENPSITYEKKMTSQNSAISWYRWTDFAIFDENKETVEYHSIGFDITDRKNYEKSLRENENQYKSVVDNIAIGVALINSEMEILSLNKQMKQWFSYVDLSLKPKCYNIFNTDKEDNDNICSYCPSKKTFKDGKIHEAVTQKQEGDKTRYFRIISSPVFEDDSVISVVELIEEITTYLESELELIRASTIWQNTFDAMEDWVFIVDENYNIVKANSSVREAFNDKQFLGEKCYKIIHGLESPIEECVGCKIFKNGQNIKLEFQEINLNNKWFELSAYPVKNDKNITDQVIHVMKDITRYKNIEVKLEKAKIESDNLNKKRSEFVSVMSQEIKSPLNGIIGMLNLLISTDLSNQQQKYVDVIKNSSDNLLHIVNDIIDFSKIDAFCMELQKIDFDLNTVMEDVRNILENMAQEKGIKFDFEIDKNIPANIVGDPLRLKQILVNIGLNSVKFTEKGNIKISTTLFYKDKKKISIKFEVTDTGIGMNDNKLQNLFEPFCHINDIDRQKYGGIGVELSIAKKIIEMMDGKIDVISEEGKGTTFIFTTVFDKQIKKMSK